MDLDLDLDLTVPGPGDLARVGEALATWQHDGAGLQLHPGDLGWHSTHGAEATASALRVWSTGGRPVALGLLDASQLLRVAVDPQLADDGGLAERMAADLADPASGVLDAGQAVVEARAAAALTRALTGAGWVPDETWTPLRRGLGEAPTPDPTGIRVEDVDDSTAPEWARVHWSAFRGGEVPADQRDRYVLRWRTMGSGPFGDRARTLLGRDASGTAVAVVTVWSAGPGRPGLLEPMGVHEGHRGGGHGTAIVRAAARALQAMGASSAVVCTPTDRVGAVRTYVAGGFTAQEPVPDLRRPA
ncbi:GNAT family N-acetyltransferase [Terracoccus luteus]|uniref:GNAT superfamily N-acetyltransferase n=1 Tax=Terracoccus luteus TaxID=53356 RepID=A0A839PSQ5_9MICO|nr:GNAT family N-acetyltransferase [Terracoccus luteus]MBB2986557.1 GNAT superfamily N-acetyltransferase [Terracoccus luteus]MCP2171854.1 GNAT superfamily N-acetyltransferase [Terracoccus luteus]